MSASAWTVLAVTWTVIAFFTGRFFLMVLRSQAEADGGAGSEPAGVAEPGGAGVARDEEAARQEPAVHHHVCPWWLGYLLASPLRRLFEKPEQAVAPYLREGMTALDVGPGMGFFTLPMARLVGPAGRVIAVDLQPRMLAGLRRRARKAGLLDRIDARLAAPASLGLDDCAGAVDFALAMAVVHEVPDADRLFAELRRIVKPGGRLLVAEPPGHVSPAAFQATLEAAGRHGFSVLERPRVRRHRDRAALLG